ncbi:MAG: hypothetical protein ABI700_27350 [Chloroflexota bacterium]
MHGGIDWLEQLLEQQKQSGLTVGVVTSGESDVTSGDDPAVTPKRVTRRRVYKARARLCKCCHNSFTPKANRSAKYCSDRCRKKDNRAKMAKTKKAKTSQVERELEVCTCLWCGGTWLADPSRDPKYCSPSHRTAAYRQRQFSAVKAVAAIKNYSTEQAIRLIKTSGMRKTGSWLRRHGYIYDDSARQWLIAMQPGELFAR